MPEEDRIAVSRLKHREVAQRSQRPAAQQRSSCLFLEPGIYIFLRAFVQLRKSFSSKREIEENLKDLENHLEKHDEDIKLIFEAIRQLMEPPDPKPKKIGFTARERQAKYGTKPRKRR